MRYELHLCKKCGLEKPHKLDKKNHRRFCCVDCLRVYQAAANKKLMLDVEKRAITKARQREQYRASAELRQKILMQAKLWQINNPERYRERLKRWAADNPTRVRAHAAKCASRRRSVLRAACPKWLDKEDRQIMTALYETAQQMTAGTGVKYEVDHIVPLRGKLVCGLHVPFNLRIVTRRYNRIKHANFPIQ